MKLKGLEGEQIEEELAEVVAMSKAVFRNQAGRLPADLGTKDLKVIGEEASIRNLALLMAEENKEDTEPIAEAEGKYIIALSSRGKFSRLHAVGGCWRAKGHTFVDFEVLAEMPEPSFYNAKCRLCWPEVAGRAKTSDEAPGDEAEGSGSSSSTSSSS